MLKERVGEVISRKIMGVAPETMISEAVGLMRKERISCVPVLADGMPAGIITERGLVHYMASHGAALTEMPVREIMSSPVTTVSSEAYVYEALQILLSKGIRHLVVVDGEGQAIGVLTLSNLIEGIGSDLLVEFQPVELHMSRAVYAVEEDVDLAVILDDMSRKSISCVLYAREGRPEGLLTERDLVRLALDGAPLSETSITQVMSSPVFTVRRQTPVHEVARVMRDKGIRRVVVVDGEGRIDGLATQTNIIRSLESNYIKVLKQVIEEKDDRIEDAHTKLDKVSLYLDSILNTSIDMAIVATDEEYRVIFYNACAEHILGLKPNDVLGRHVLELHDQVGVAVDQFEMIMEKTREEGCHTFSFERVHENSERYFQARVAAILDNERAIEGYVFMVRDITERKRAEENIRYMAYHDILTGLPNRVSFNERLGLELAHAERGNTRLAVMVMDLDRFKEVNDTMGHFTGDLLLEEVARRLSGALRRSDTVARVGGDEFMVVLPKISENESVLSAAAKMAEATLRPFEVRA